MAPPTRPSDKQPPVMHGPFCLVPRVSVHDRYYCISICFLQNGCSDSAGYFVWLCILHIFFCLFPIRVGTLNFRPPCSPVLCFLRLSCKLSLQLSVNFEVVVRLLYGNNFYMSWQEIVILFKTNLLHCYILRNYQCRVMTEDTMYVTMLCLLLFRCGGQQWDIIPKRDK